MNNEKMDQFLEKIDEVHDSIGRILDGKMSEKEYDEIERRINADKYDKELKEKLERQKEEKQREENQKKLLGESGKGEGENYLYFCPKCQLEFKVEVKKCGRCANDLMTQKQRREQLMQKVQEYKEEKNKKEERKKRWDLWKKTKQVYKKAKLIDYEKWNYFTDSEESDEEYKEKNPILPKDNPQFQALEKDIKQRQERQRKQKEIGENLKNNGNKFFQAKDYYKAIQEYDKGIEADRNNKAIWLNRALAKIKFGNLQGGIDDCTQMIEYMEVLEDGFEKSKNFAIKAFLRRSQAYFQLKQFKLSFKDAEKAKEIDKDDKEIEDHYQLVKQSMEMNEKIEQDEEGDQLLIEIMNSQNNWEKLSERLAKDDKIKAKFLLGEVNFLKDQLTYEKINESFSQEKIVQKNVLNFIQDNMDDLFIDFYLRKNVIYELIKNLKISIEKLSSNEEISDYFQSEQILEVLQELSLDNKGRIYLVNKQKLLIEIFMILEKKFMEKNEKFVFLMNLFFKILSNTFYAAKDNRTAKSFACYFFEENKNRCFYILTKILLKDKIFAELVSSIFSLLTNLINITQIRESIIIDLKPNKEIFSIFSEFFPKTNSKSLLINVNNFLINLSFKNPKLLEELLPENFSKVFKDFFIKNHSQLESKEVEQLSQTLKKLPMNQLEMKLVVQILVTNYFLQQIRSCTQNQTVQILNSYVPKLPNEFLLKFNDQFKEAAELFVDFLNKSADEVTINNSLVFITSLIQKIPTLNENYGLLLEPIVFIVKEKIGQVRKSAAILLANLCKNEQNLKKAREMHATELLMNLSHVLLQQLIF